MPEEKDQSTSVSKEEEKSSTDDYSALAQQIQSEYHLAWQHQHPKKVIWEKRLKLYNNQRRDIEKVGDTTLFTIHQTILASLYDDRLMVEFNGREEGDEEVGENLTATAEYDYDQMAKDELDYDWDWDTAFFGRGYVAMEEFERDPDNNTFIPLPEVLDPITFLRDPRARSVNGNPITGKGNARFMGYEVKMTKPDMKDNTNMFDSVDYSAVKIGSSTMSLLRTAMQARDHAQGRQEQEKLNKEESLGENAEYDITIWYTNYKIDGKLEKVKVWLANERSKVIGLQVIKNDYWPIIDRSLYPTAHDWDGTSIPDLVEDKQRARAVAQNLGLDAMRADLYPMYIYDTNKITNRKDLKFKFNKFLPVDAKEESVSNAIQPLIKARPNLGLLDFIYNSLDASAQKATATPEIQQGAVSEEKRTLGELNLIASKVDTRYSLSAKVFGWSEKRFWQQWYQLYKDNFAKDIDEKVIRIQGAFGPKWRPFENKDLIPPRLDPDVVIESRAISRAKQLEERTSLTQYFALVIQDPTANRRYGLKKLGKLYGMKKDELDRILPPTIDERIANQQNDELNKDNFVGVLAEDDHNVHLEIHAKANLTDATEAHIKTHEQALSIKKTNPELFPADQAETEFQQGSAPTGPGGPAVPATPAGPGGPKPIPASQTSGIPT